MDRLPRLGKRELMCLLLFTCNYVVSVWRGFLLLLVLGKGYVILLWHSLSLPYNYFTGIYIIVRFFFQCDDSKEYLLAKKRIKSQFLTENCNVNNRGLLV